VPLGEVGTKTPQAAFQQKSDLDFYLIKTRPGKNGISIGVFVFKTLLDVSR
jgi:hypothetical protein